MSMGMDEVLYVSDSSEFACECGLSAKELSCGLGLGLMYLEERTSSMEAQRLRPCMLNLFPGCGVRD